jgi:SAM-dependent methyltransferase
VTGGQSVDGALASSVGGRTLEVFADTPRLNRWIHSKFAPHIRGDVLEVGSGIGNLSRLIVENASPTDRIVLTDMESHYLETLSATFASDRRVTVARYDLDQSPSPAIASSEFDTIVAVNVVEHIRDDGALAGALAGLLRPGGRLVLYVPACPFAYGSLDRALGHYRRYTPNALEELLRAAGLEPQRPRYMNLFGLFGWLLNGRLFRRKQLSPFQISVFERLMPLFRVEDWFRVPLGLGLHTVATKPG